MKPTQLLNVSLLIKDSHGEIRDINLKKWALGSVTVGLAIVLIFSSFYVVGAGERGVIYDSLQGGVQETPTEEGIHLKIPIFQQITKYDVKNNLYETGASSASRDLQEVETNVAVRFAPVPGETPWLHQNFGINYADKIITPGVQESVKAATARYNAEELITKRAEVKQLIFEMLKTRLENQRIILYEMDITDFQFSENFDLAIEAKVTAEQKALEEQNRLEQIRFQAQQRVVQAQGEADAIRISAEAEANKTQLINEQLKVSPLYLQYLWIQAWNGTLPGVVASEQSSMLLQIPNQQNN